MGQPQGTPLQQDSLCLLDAQGTLLCQGNEESNELLKVDDSAAILVCLHRGAQRCRGQYCCLPNGLPGIAQNICGGLQHSGMGKQSSDTIVREKDTA